MRPLISKAYNFDPLIRHANWLKLQASNSSLLPSLLFLTDEARTPDPLSTVRMLPRGTAVIFRHYTDRNRNTLARELRRECRSRNLPFIIAGGGALASDVAADGIHLPQWQIPEIIKYKRNKRIHFITAAVHDLPSLIKAANLGASALLAAPVFPTASHLNRPHLGVSGLAALAHTIPAPVYALGGITARNSSQILGTGAAGIAGIGMFLMAGGRND